MTYFQSDRLRDALKLIAIFLVVLEVILSIVVVGITAASAHGFQHDLQCDSPSKLNYNIAAVSLSLQTKPQPNSSLTHPKGRPNTHSPPHILPPRQIPPITPSTPRHPNASPLARHLRHLRRALGRCDRIFSLHVLGPMFSMRQHRGILHHLRRQML